ncbi:MULTISPECIES: ASCH domain-containing protein [Dickeya]|uniref:ASCH domain-containing protein n=1 Tax=Dickeya TaxID=204037 RepID=UPI000577BF2B|nr:MULTISPECIES: ASCH domain-containing protein [Dickeya]UGA50151.1 ASCH domain-containing protein [Dickeya fangzhongdai]UWH06504.1 ASCH domain-containing protein [Dickeya fangzhongdai]
MSKASIKALSVVAPAGLLIATGKKTIEVRRWLPDLSPEEDLLIVENLNYLTKDGDEEPGIAVAVVNISSVRPFTPDDIPAACASSFEEGWFAWEISNIRQVGPAINARAARKIYTVEWD